MTVRLFLKKYILYIAWVQALAGTLISLYFSEIMHLPPCTLCWYQRVFYYPIVFILSVGILRKDFKHIFYYVFPLSIVGWSIAFFHVLLERGIIPESAGPCAAGISCTTRYIEWFGFLTIPLLSFIGFSIIILCMVIYKKLKIKS